MDWKKLLDRRLEEALIVATLAIMLLIIIYQVIARNFFGTSLVWGEEIAVFLHIWIVWVGASLGIRHRQHVKIDVFANLFSGKARIFVELLAIISFFIMAVFLAVGGAQFTATIFASGQLAPTIDIYMGFAYLAIPVAGILMTARLVQQIYFLFKGSEGKGEKV